ncbi:carbohydrate ABC transporter permease [Cohnella cholangitidis]|uniref:Carbohydrate ABC transporter permease n=1 Tax=Cohnella cholangitidis TaxID=2598458 RepID=A0A7G5BUD7_9BACL|nr:carbohydrate ABC transporter permease [Cohnella cholangitidis]QMV40571.1 carbohydrate ABC transporter permease [Cohnella cholangitidis]
MNARQSERLLNGLTYAALTVVALIFLLPILWIVRTSFTTKAIAYQIPPKWFVEPTLDNYRAIFSDNPFGSYFLNSMVVSLVSTIIAVFLGAMAAYWIARQVKGGNFLRIAILGTQMLPPIVMVIPIFMMIKKLDLLDSWLALIVTYLSFSLPYMIWLLIGFFEGIPKDLDEACEIDGCTKMQAFTRVVLPLAAPGIMAAGILSFLMAWNEFLFALVLTGTGARTLPVAIANMETQQGVMIAQLCAATVIIILPVVVLSLFIQKYLVNGMTMGSVK